MKTDKTPAIFLRGRRSPYHNLSTRIPASIHVFLDGVPFLYFRESARVQSFKCCIVLTRAQMEIHHVLFTASKKHYTLPPVPQRRRPAPGVFCENYPLPPGPTPLPDRVSDHSVPQYFTNELQTPIRHSEQGQGSCVWVLIIP